MSYSLNFTDRIANSEGIIVNDNTINTSTSLGFPGRNQKGYAVTIAENFLHLLENFSALTEPANKITGQLWFDKTNNVIKVFNEDKWQTLSVMTYSTSSSVSSSSTFKPRPRSSLTITLNDSGIPGSNV